MYLTIAGNPLSLEGWPRATCFKVLTLLHHSIQANVQIINILIVRVTRMMVDQTHLELLVEVSGRDPDASYTNDTPSSGSALRPYAS